MKNYYEILEVNPTASSDIINKIFKIQIKKNHPDLFQGEEKINAENKMKEINEAYEVLSNKEKRDEYDKELNEKEANILTDTTSNTTFSNNEELINSIKNENILLKQELNEKNTILDELLNSLSDTDYINFSQRFVNRQYTQESENNNDPQNNNNSVEHQSYKKESYSRYVLNTLKNFIFKLSILILFTLTVLFFASLLTNIDFSKILNAVFQ